MEHSNKSASYTLEQSRLMIQRRNGSIPYTTVASLQKALCKGLKACQRDELRRQYKAGLRAGRLTAQFLDAVFPHIPGVMSRTGNQLKFLVFPDDEPLPPINPAYTARVTELSNQREMDRAAVDIESDLWSDDAPIEKIIPPGNQQEIEKELAEIYLTIDAIDLSSDPFPVDLGEAARWLGYSGEPRTAKASAKDALMKLEYKENSDYCLRRNIPTQTGRGGHNAEEIRLSAECFKDFCLQSGAKRGPSIRKYFIAAEQRFRALTKGDAIQVSSNPSDLENVVRRAVRNEAEQQITAAVGEIGETLGSVEVKVLTAIEVMQQQLETLKATINKSQTPSVADLKRLHGSLYQQVLEQSYHYPDGIHCPCCNKPTNAWEVDHWNSKTNPARTNGWKVCRPCNQALGAAGDNTKRHHYKSRFDAFQVRCDDFEQYLKGDELQLGLL